jgi:hypothetical protein
MLAVNNKLISTDPNLNEIQTKIAPNGAIFYAEILFSYNSKRTLLLLFRIPLLH